MAKSSRVVPHIFSEFDPPPDPGVDCSVLPSMTQQNFAAECDINNIMKRFEATGLLPDDSLGAPQFADVASAGDYHAAQNLIVAANEAFMDLPPKVRKRFSNDPVQFLSFIDSLNSGDEALLNEAISLGLLKPLDKASGAAPAGPPDSPLAGAAGPLASQAEPLAKPS